MKRGSRIWRWWAIGAVTVVIVFAALNSEMTFLLVAMVTAERRPSLLDDARWGRLETARKFNATFHRDTPEAKLRSWLDANRFSTDSTGQHAVRQVKSLPCNEQIDVNWKEGDAGRIANATARVREAGCL